MTKVPGCLQTMRGIRARTWRPLTLAAPILAALYTLVVTSDAEAQDTTTVMRVQGISIQVPRPATTTGGTSAVEVSLDSLQVVAAPTVEELLRSMPLIQIRANSRGEAQPNLRGAEDRQIAIFVDGIPLTLGWDHRTDLSVLPLTAVRNMTLLRGLSSVLHGPNVLGGAVEFDVARGAAQQTPPPSVTASATVDQEGGRSAAATGGAFIERDYSSWVLRGGVGYRERPGLALSEATLKAKDLRLSLLADSQGRRLNSDRRHFDGFASARYQGIGGSWVSGLLSGFTAERGVAPEAHVSEPRLWRYPKQERALLAVSGGTGARITSAGTGDLEFSLGVDRSINEIDEYESEAFSTIVDGENSNTTTLTGRILGDHTVGARGEVRTAFTIASVSHDETFDDGSTFDYQQRLWSYGAEYEFGTDGIFGFGPRGVTNWTLGGAVDGASTPKSGDKPPLSTMWDWGIRMGSTTSPSDGRLILHWGVSRRTRFPSLRELYSGALGRFEPNPDLRPEKLRAAEVGVTLQTVAGQIQFVGFHQRLEDGIVRTRVSTDSGSRFKRENRNEVRSTGVEALLSGGFRAFTYGADLTLQRVRIRDAAVAGQEDRAEYQPAVAGKLSLAVSLPREFIAGTFIRFRGQQFCQNPEADQLDSIDASASLDLELRRVFFPRTGLLAPTSRLEASVGLANLTDIAVYDQCGLPQPGRTLRIQFNLR